MENIKFTFELSSEGVLYGEFYIGSNMLYDVALPNVGKADQISTQRGIIKLMENFPSGWESIN